MPPEEAPPSTPAAIGACAGLLCRFRLAALVATAGAAALASAAGWLLAAEQKDGATWGLHAEGTTGTESSRAGLEAAVAAAAFAAAAAAFNAFTAAVS